MLSLQNQTGIWGYFGVLLKESAGGHLWFRAEWVCTSWKQHYNSNSRSAIVVWQNMGHVFICKKYLKLIIHPCGLGGIKSLDSHPIAIVNGKLYTVVS